MDLSWVRQLLLRNKFDQQSCCKIAAVRLTVCSATHLAIVARGLGCAESVHEHPKIRVFDKGTKRYIRSKYRRLWLFRGGLDV